MTRYLTPEETDALGDSEIRGGLFLIGVLSVLTIAAVLFGTIAAAQAMPDLIWVVFVGVFAIGGASIAAVAILAYRRRIWLVNVFVDMRRALLDAELDEREATTTLPTTTYLPTKVEEPREIPHNVGDRAGVLVIDFINGFDPRDLAYFAKYLANGGRTSENVLQDVTLPYEGLKFGGAVDGTRFTRILDLCEKRGILTPRDKARRKPGTLLIPNEQEILRLLLQEETPTP
jgi:hypothetical protein